MHVASNDVLTRTENSANKDVATKTEKLITAIQSSAMARLTKKWPLTFHEIYQLWLDMHRRSLPVPWILAAPKRYRCTVPTFTYVFFRNIIHCFWQITATLRGANQRNPSCFRERESTVLSWEFEERSCGCSKAERRSVGAFEAKPANPTHFVAKVGRPKTNSCLLLVATVSSATSKPSLLKKKRMKNVAGIHSARDRV